MENGLSLDLSETPKTGFSPVVARLIFFIKLYYIQHGGCSKYYVIYHEIIGPDKQLFCVSI